MADFFVPKLIRQKDIFYVLFLTRQSIFCFDARHNGLGCIHGGK